MEYRLFFRYNGKIIETVDWLSVGGKGDCFTNPRMTPSSVKLAAGCFSVVSVPALAWVL